MCADVGIEESEKAVNFRFPTNGKSPGIMCEIIQDH